MNFGDLYGKVGYFFGVKIIYFKNFVNCLFFGFKQVKIGCLFNQCDWYILDLMYEFFFNKLRFCLFVS